MTHRQMPGRKAGQQNGFTKIFLSDSKLKTTSFPKSFHLVAHNLHINHYRRTVKDKFKLGHCHKYYPLGLPAHNG